MRSRVRERQIELLEEGKEVIQETRPGTITKESSHAMRSKEDAKDYRYFPDPDLQPMQIPTEWMEQIRSRQPEFQEERAMIRRTVRSSRHMMPHSDPDQTYGRYV